MTKTKAIILALFFSSTAFSDQIFSGMVSLASQAKDSECQIEGNQLSEKIKCELKYSEDQKSNYIEFNLTQLNLSDVPTCVFNGITDPITKKPHELNLTLFSTNQLRLSIASKKPYGGIALFICSSSDRKKSKIKAINTWVKSDETKIK